MLPAAVTEAVVQEQMPSTQAWAVRSGWTVSYDPAASRGVACAVHQVMGQMVAFFFDTTGYPAVPPAWWCGPVPARPTDTAWTSVEVATVASVKSHYPAAGTGGSGAPSGSIFHPQPVICAPWNRLAYGDDGGPHDDWGALTQWRNAGAGSTQAHTIPDMLNTLSLHLRFSPGMSS